MRERSRAFDDAISRGYLDVCVSAGRKLSLHYSNYTTEHGIPDVRVRRVGRNFQAECVLPIDVVFPLEVDGQTVYRSGCFVTTRTKAEAIAAAQHLRGEGLRQTTREPETYGIQTVKRYGEQVASKNQ